MLNIYLPWGFPGGSDGKESACNVGDLGSVPGSGRSPGEGNGNPLQYSCLGNPMDRGAWQAIVHGVTESDMTEQLTLTYLPCVPAIIFLLFTQEKEKHAHKNNHTRFLAALFTVNTHYEHTKMSTNTSMNKQTVAYPCNGITLINKKTELLISMKI